jgi:hypothetical protein
MGCCGWVAKGPCQEIFTRFVRRWLLLSLLLMMNPGSSQDTFHLVKTLSALQGSI